jgi:hypothetical protein
VRGCRWIFGPVDGVGQAARARVNYLWMITSKTSFDNSKKVVYTLALK